MTGANEAVSGAALVEALQVGDPQVHGPLAVFPLRLAENGGPGYVTLRQAIAGGQAAITEVSEGGSVPELRVVNKGGDRVLVLDGEELRGAKQNRVLNTSILIGGHSSLVVPVSCTEQGRWSYASREFDESEVVADRQVRFAMKESVSANLVAGAGHRSDQGRVWSEVSALHSRHATHSPTGAMRDAYQTRKGDLDAVLAAFPLLDGQQGILVLPRRPRRRSRPRSRAPQYAELHDKLLRSYAFEALVAGGEPGDRPSPTPSSSASPTCPAAVQEPGPRLGRALRGRRSARLGAHVPRARRARGVLRCRRCHGRRRGRHAGHAGHRPRPDWRIADARERARRRQGR